jgi:hypothetical protein
VVVEVVLRVVDGGFENDVALGRPPGRSDEPLDTRITAYTSRQISATAATPAAHTKPR